MSYSQMSNSGYPEFLISTFIFNEVLGVSKQPAIDGYKSKCGYTGLSNQKGQLQACNGGVGMSTHRGQSEDIPLTWKAKMERSDSKPP